MKIVGCYIVKNEAAALQRSLASIKSQVDEVVVVDTGSTDHTIVAAQAAGARIYHFPWQDDFAAARNFALTKLSGDWVVFLDADEYFSEATVGNLRKLIEAQDRDINLLLVNRQDVDTDGQILMNLYVPRIFRIRDDLRYVGAIHEELRQAGEIVTGIACVKMQDLNLIHTGYAGAAGITKARRNLTLLQREMAKSSRPEVYYGYLAEAYDGLNDRENAMKYAYLDIARGRQAETYASRSYRLLLEKLAENKYDYLERKRIAEMAVRDFPELPEFHAELAESLAAGWQYEDAVAEMQRACELGTNYQGLEPSLFDQAMMEKCQERIRFLAHLSQLGEKLAITACVITKNEAANIGAWLENANEYADDCVVLDTGSVDNTCELVMAAGRKLYHYEWQDDFAAARNQALKYVTGDWVAFLDADHILLRAGQLRGFLAEMEALHPEVEAVRMTICNVDADDGNREISRLCHVHLFRNKPDLRYYGRVHENLLHADGTQPVVYEESRLILIHTGYSTSKVMDKVKRNLALLQRDIKDNGLQPQHYRYMADCYYALGDYQQAELYALKAIEAPLKGLGTHGDMYYMVLLCMKALAEPVEDQLAFAAAAGNKFPEVPDFPAVQGIIYYQAGDYEQGQSFLAKACKIAAASAGRESSSFADMAAMAYAAKAACEAKLGNRKQALQDSRQAVELNPGEELALEVFCSLRQGNDLLHELQAFFSDSKQDRALLGRFAERQGFGQLYCLYGAGGDRQRYYRLLQEGKWPELLEKIQGGLLADMELAIALLLRLEQQQGKHYRQMERQLLALLPGDVQDCWQAVMVGQSALNWQVYPLIWKFVLAYGDDEQVVRMGLLALAKSEIWASMRQELLEQEKWQVIFDIMAQVPQEQADGDFWLVLGRCLYHLGEYEAARESLNRARQLGAGGFLLQAYEFWLAAKEKMQKK